jgi:hypothetical protein
MATVSGDGEFVRGLDELLLLVLLLPVVFSTRSTLRARLSFVVDLALLLLLLLIVLDNNASFGF